jgi:acyl-CoA thioesterase FadM
MYSQEHQRLVAIANATIVTYDYVKQSKAPVPESLRQGIQAIEQQV